MAHRPPERTLRGGIAFAVFILTTACGSAGPTPIVFDEPLPDDPGPDVGGKALQDRIFADGVVTAAEYERAYAKALDCMREEGFDVVGPMSHDDSRAPMVIEPGSDPRLRLSSFARNTDRGDGVDRFGPVNGRCQAQWSYAVELVYLGQFAPTEAETQAWIERAWECMRENGHPINEPPTLEDATASVAYGCEPWLVDEDPET
jgi:hypothetical protein